MWQKQPNKQFKDFFLLTA